MKEYIKEVRRIGSNDFPISVEVFKLADSPIGAVLVYLAEAVYEYEGSNAVGIYSGVEVAAQACLNAAVNGNGSGVWHVTEFVVEGDRHAPNS